MILIHRELLMIMLIVVIIYKDIIIRAVISGMSRTVMTKLNAAKKHYIDSIGVFANIFS